MNLKLKAFSTRTLRLRVFCLFVLGAYHLGCNASSQAAPISIHDDTGVAFDSPQLSIAGPTVPAQDDRMILVGFFSISENFVDVQSTSLTFDGQQLTHAGGIVQNVFTDWWSRVDIYYLLDPSPGVFQPFIGTVNAWNPTGFRQESAWGMWALSLSGVAQQAPTIALSKLQNPNAPSVTLGGNVTTTKSDSLLVGFTGLNAGLSGDRLFSTTGVTELVDSGAGPMNYGAGYKHAPAAGTTPFTWTTNGFSTGIGATVIVEVEAAVIPEPATASLLLLGLAAGLVPISRLRNRTSRG